MEYSLQTPQNCEEIMTTFNKTPQKMPLSIIKKKDKKKKKIRNCLIEASTCITQCGHDGHFTYIYDCVPVLPNHVQYVDEEDCNSLFNQNGKVTFSIGNNEVTLSEGIRGGDFITQSFRNLMPGYIYKTSGSKEIEGYTGGYWACLGADFTHDGKEYEDSLLRVNWKMELQIKDGYYDFDEQSIIIPNEITFPALESTNGFDRTLGVFTWTKYIPNCPDKLETIMDGVGEWYTSNNDQIDDIVLIKANNRYAGFSLSKNNITLCGKEFHQTQMTDIFIASSSNSRKLANTGFGPSYDANTLLTNIKSMIATQYISQEKRLDRAFQTLSIEICEVQRQILMSNLAALQNHDEYYASQKLFEKTNNTQKNGIKYIKAGSVSYEITCSATQVEIFRGSNKNCFQEIAIYKPGSGRQDIAFVEPISKVIVDNGTLIPCSRTTPVKWQINEKWWCLIIVAGKHTIFPCKNPIRTSPMDSMLMKKYYSYDQNVLTDQLFSVEDLKEWKRFNNYGNFRESVSSEFTNVLLNPNGNENSYFRNQLTKSMNYEELRKQILPWWTDFLSLSKSAIGTVSTCGFILYVFISTSTCFFRIFKMIQVFI